MIGLVSCGASKLDRPAPAAELYTSSLFRLSLEHARATCETIYVLSALHGLLPIDEVIAPYDRRLGGKKDREAWARRVASNIAAKHPKSEPITILAGLDYAGPLRVALLTMDGYQRVNKHADHYEWRGWRGAVEFPLAGLTMGRRLQWLTAAARKRAA